MVYNVSSTHSCTAHASHYLVIPTSHLYKWQNILPASEGLENILHLSLVLRLPSDRRLKVGGEDKQTSG